jgi:uncharacterized protein (TIGR02996 family)
MDEEKSFLAAIKANPRDVSLHLVYADWLEERGDPRATDIRAKYQYRQPIRLEETRRFKAIATARADATAGLVRLRANAARPGHRLSTSSQETLASDLRHLSALAVAQNFPRDDDGRLRLNCEVLLGQYACTEALPRLRELCLVATGPARRSDPQIINVRLELLIPENQQHDWSEMRWWWDEREARRNENARWGVSSRALREITGRRRDGKIAELQKLWRANRLTDSQRAALCTALQDDGRFEDALRLCGVEFPETLSRMLDAEPFKLRGGCCEPGTKESAAVRALRLRRALWEAAPWRWLAVLNSIQRRLDAWREARANRPRKTPELRFFILPGSSHHARKPGLMLLWGNSGNPRLDFIFTAANVTLPESSWMRPVELDIGRWGS